MDLSFGTINHRCEKKHAGIYHKVKEFCKPHRHFSSRISQSEVTKPLTSFSLRVISSKIHVLRLFEVDAHRVRPVCGLHFHERARKSTSSLSKMTAQTMIRMNDSEPSSSFAMLKTRFYFLPPKTC